MLSVCRKVKDWNIIWRKYIQGIYQETTRKKKKKNSMGIIADANWAASVQSSVQNLDQKLLTSCGSGILIVDSIRSYFLNVK